MAFRCNLTIKNCFRNDRNNFFLTRQSRGIKGGRTRNKLINLQWPIVIDSFSTRRLTRLALKGSIKRSSSQSLDFNLCAREQCAATERILKWNVQRSKEGKSELIISSQKYTRRNAIYAGGIFPEGNLLTSMERFKILRVVKKNGKRIRI